MDPLLSALMIWSSADKTKWKEWFFIMFLWDQTLRYIIELRPALSTQQAQTCLESPAFHSDFTDDVKLP